MKFRWNPPIGGEWSAGDPPPIWIYAVLFFLLLCLFAGGTIAMWPHGKPVASDDFVRTALVAPFLLWVAISSTIYTWMYSSLAFEVAVKNTARWHVLTRWQRKVRAGVAVLDSVVLTQVPDLAERMLKLEGDPPDNPGKVMRLDSVDEVEDALRERAMLERLLTPLTVRLARAARGDSKGLAQHATLGAVRDTELKVEEHALDPAMGPQAPVARWVLQALAAKMAHFGQGAQLVALPRANGVALNIVVKDAPAANVPWKAEYEYNIFAWADLLVCMSLWAFVIMVSPDKTWGTFETVFTVAIVVAVLLIFAWRIYLGPRIYTDYVWLKYG